MQTLAPSTPNDWPSSDDDDGGGGMHKLRFKYVYMHALQSTNILFVYRIEFDDL